MTWLAENWFTLASAVLGTLSGLYMIGALISPKTENKWDDKITAGLGWILGIGRRLLSKVKK